MMSPAFLDLLHKVEREHFTRGQLGQLLAAISTRIGRLEQHEFAAVTQNVADAVEAFAEASQKADEREERIYGLEPDECDLARIARACGAL